MDRIRILGMVFTIVVFCFVATGVFADEEWTTATNGQDIYKTNTGNVGIGTDNPESSLHVTTSNSAVMKFTRSGMPLVFGYEMGGTTFGLYDYTNSNYKWMVFDNNICLNPNGGNVGIGISSPGAKLDVNGTIKAKEIKVNIASVDEVKINDAQWSDFVFEDSYKLPSLDHVENYIKENKHLPDVPSAEQIAQDGLSMSEMMAKQMQKIEELTLYVIELKKENEELKIQSAQEISELRAEISALKK